MQLISALSGPHYLPRRDLSASSGRVCRISAVYPFFEHTGSDTPKRTGDSEPSGFAELAGQVLTNCLGNRVTHRVADLLIERIEP
jgi:hypothetical protein